MKMTQSINALSLLFECDRSTLVRALRNVAPDSETTPGRPEWKISTGMNALISHRASTGRVDSRRQHDRGGGSGDFNSDWQDPLLVQLFAAQDEADQAMRASPTLEGRRKAAVAMVPLIGRTDKAMRERGRANGLDPDAVDLRADSLYMLQMRGLETPCEWTQSECWKAMSDA